MCVVVKTYYQDTYVLLYKHLCVYINVQVHISCHCISNIVYTIIITGKW